MMRLALLAYPRSGVPPDHRTDAPIALRYRIGTDQQKATGPVLAVLPAACLLRGSGALAAAQIRGRGRLEPAGQPDSGDPERREDRAEDVHSGDHDPARDDQHLQRGARPERPAHAAASYQAAEQCGGYGQAAADTAGEGAVKVLEHDGDRDGEADDDGLHGQHRAAQLPHRFRPARRGRRHESSAAVKVWRDGWLADGSAGSSPPPGTSSLRASPAVMTDPVTSTPALPGTPVTAASSASRSADCTRSSPKISAARSAASAGSIDRSEELRVTTIWSSSGSSSASMPGTSLSPLAAKTPAR